MLIYVDLCCDIQHFMCLSVSRDSDSEPTDDRTCFSRIGAYHVGCTVCIFTRFYWRTDHRRAEWCQSAWVCLS